MLGQSAVNILYKAEKIHHCLFGNIYLSFASILNKQKPLGTSKCGKLVIHNMQQNHLQHLKFLHDLHELSY